jgi:hypothetical protein
MPRRVRDDVGERHVVGGDDEVASPHEHEPRGVHVAVHLGDRDLAEVPPTPGVVEVVVPLLEHQPLRTGTGPTVHAI